MKFLLVHRFISDAARNVPVELTFDNLPFGRFDKRLIRQIYLVLGCYPAGHLFHEPDELQQIGGVLLEPLVLHRDDHAGDRAHARAAVNRLGRNLHVVGLLLPLQLEIHERVQKHQLRRQQLELRELQLPKVHAAGQRLHNLQLRRVQILRVLALEEEHGEVVAARVHVDQAAAVRCGVLLHQRVQVALREIALNRLEAHEQVVVVHEIGRAHV